jgi:OOP family OmpA-OmpF porin
MKKQILIALIGTALAAPFAAQAQASYVGVNVGRAEQKLSVDGVGSIKDSDTGFKLYGGYAFHKNFGAEIGYVDLGKASVTDGIDTASSEPTALYAAVTGTFPLNEQFSLTGKVGVAANRVKVKFTGEPNSTEKHTSVMFGIGAAYNFAPNLAAVVEYEKFGKVLKEEGGNLKADLISVGVQYKF